jgi:hypothetical protein
MARTDNEGLDHARSAKTRCDRNRGGLCTGRRVRQLTRLRRTADSRTYSVLAVSRLTPKRLPNLVLVSPSAERPCVSATRDWSPVTVGPPGPEGIE